ncbi:MAG TPA: hypothetical protein PKC30_10850 [Saprospiraceae bacterium]|nr:hypothetical protein [Saprospiraceae bacterium]
MRILKSSYSKKKNKIIPQIHCLERYQRKLTLLSALGVISMASVPKRVNAQCDPVNDTFLISSGIPNNFKGDPRVAMDANGNYVVVWEEYTDYYSKRDVYGRRYAANGTSLGSPFIINEYNTYNQGDPSIAMQANGDFIVVWVSDGQDEDGFGIFGRRFQANGTPIGGEFPVNLYTTDDQEDPDIAIDENGNFVVVWESLYQLGDFVEGYEIFARLFDASGMPLTGEIQVNQHTTNSQIDPRIAMHSDGTFVVVWESDGQDGDGDGVYGRRFDNIGLPLGDEFQINQFTTEGQSDPDIAMDCLGNFVVVWESTNQDMDDRAVVARRYQADGSPLGDEFIVNTGTTGHQDDPSITMDCMGNFVITWEDARFPFDVIFAQCFDAQGERMGDEFQVVQLDNGTSFWDPSAAMDNNGNLVIVFESETYIYDNEYEYGIHGQRYTCLKSAEPDPIPTIGQWGMIIMGLFLSILASVVIKNKNLQIEKR